MWPSLWHLVVGRQLFLASLFVGLFFGFALPAPLFRVSHEHLGCMGYYIVPGCSGPVDAATCSSIGLHQQCLDTSPITTAAQERAALEEWSSVMVVGWAY
jgi:hypothetical protein